MDFLWFTYRDTVVPRNTYPYTLTSTTSRLEFLGLDEYSTRFEQEGFDTWETVLAITEPDLEALGVKIGHRRKLQKAILEEKTNRSSDDNFRRQNSFGQTDGIRDNRHVSNHNNLSQPYQECLRVPMKRKYRRHPKPDENACERPQSAYVLFSSRIRESLKDKDLNFTEIAKLVGEKWQNTDNAMRADCEKEAQATKEKYDKEFAAYKKTPEYAAYQEYLVAFKAKHSSQDSKRPRMTGGEPGQPIRNYSRLESPEQPRQDDESSSSSDRGGDNNSPRSLPSTSDVPGLQTRNQQPPIVGGGGFRAWSTSPNVTTTSTYSSKQASTYNEYAPALSRGGWSYNSSTVSARDSVMTGSLMPLTKEYPSKDYSTQDYSRGPPPPPSFAIRSDPRDVRDVRDVRDRERRDMRESRDPRDIRDPKDLRNARDPNLSQRWTMTRDAREDFLDPNNTKYRSTNPADIPPSNRYRYTSLNIDAESRRLPPPPPPPRYPTYESKPAHDILPPPWSGPNPRQNRGPDPARDEHLGPPRYSLAPLNLSEGEMLSKKEVED